MLCDQVGSFARMRVELKDGTTTWRTGRIIDITSHHHTLYHTIHMLWLIQQHIPNYGGTIATPSTYVWLIDTYDQSLSCLSPWELSSCDIIPSSFIPTYEPYTSLLAIQPSDNVMYDTMTQVLIEIYQWIVVR